MVVDHFELNEHPFLLSPAVNEYFETDGMRASRERLEVCLRNGGGIAVVTAEAGLGKTSLLYQMAGQLVPEYRVVLLKSLAYTSAEDVLKAILFELDIPYRKLSEQDLRLRLVQSAKKLKSLHAGIAILADEAHLANPVVLNELRALTNFVDGTPLFRIMVAGELEFEEQFANRDMAAFVQRIACQESLGPFTQQESMEYIDACVTAVGGDLEMIFTEEAIQLISYAANGSPRNINQLCECAMRMAAANGEQPVTRSIAKAALDELQKLPIRWNIPAEAMPETDPEPTASILESQSEVIEISADGAVELGFDDYDQFLEVEQETPTVEKTKPESLVVVETLQDDEDGFAIEFGAGIEDLDEEESIEAEVAEQETPQETAEVIEVVEAEAEVSADLEERELNIEDRYAELDYRRQQLRPATPTVSLEAELQPAVEEPAESPMVESESTEVAEEAELEQTIIEVDIQHTIAELTEAASHLLSGSEQAKADSDGDAIDKNRFDIVLPDA